MKKLQLNEKVSLGPEEYLVFDEYRPQATTITTQVLLSYLKWREENNVSKLKAYCIPDKIKKLNIKYGYLYMKLFPSIMFNYTATIMFIIRTKKGLSIWKIPVKGDNNIWKRIRYALNKYCSYQSHVPYNGDNEQ